MNLFIKASLLGMFLFYTVASFSSVGNFIELTNLQAGVDYPTDIPELKGKSVLVVNGSRIIVPDVFVLVSAIAGIDYPTDINAPAWVTFSKVLKSGNFRSPIALEKAVSGIDYATNGPAEMDRDFYVWLAGNTRIPVSQIAGLEYAQAGLDYATDGPSDMNRNFLVMILTDGSRISL